MAIIDRKQLLGVVVGFLVVLSGQPSHATGFNWQLPVGFPTPKVPDDNPISAEKVALGRFLFYDTRLSGNQTQACASCHQQALAFSDGRPHGIGSTGQVHPRGPMSLTNVTYAASLAWANPLLVTLEKQVLLPMFGDDPVELGLAGKEDELLDRMRADGRYRRLFAEAFPDESDPISVGNLVKGLTSFVRTLISGTSPYDRYIQGLDDHALSDSAVNGGKLFFTERLECFHCHGGFDFAVSVTFQGKELDETSFQNNGLYNIDGNGAYPADNTGIFAITHVPEDMGSFKAPTLRNIAVTAPYMHDGSIATLDGVLDHYAAGGRTISDGPYAGDGSKNPFKSGFIRGFTLSEQERQDVLNFLESLTDQEFLTNPRISDPYNGSSCVGDCNYDQAVTVDELITEVNIALGQAPLAGCVVGDANGDGQITIEELLLAVNRALTGCPTPTQTPTPTPTATPTPSEPEHSENLFGSTVAGGGALTIDAAAVVEVTFTACLGGTGDTCAGGIVVYGATDPGFKEAEDDEPEEPLFTLPESVPVTLEVTAIDPGIALKFDETTLTKVGDSVLLGTTPGVHRDVEWEVSAPGGPGLPAAGDVSLKLTTTASAFAASTPFTVTLQPVGGSGL